MSKDCMKRKKTAVIVSYPKDSGDTTGWSATHRVMMVDRWDPMVRGAVCAFGCAGQPV